MKVRGLDDDELRMAIQRLARRIRSNRSDQDLSDTQLGVLFSLEKSPGSTPSELAEREHVRPPSMNRTLNALEERGLVSRTPAPGDARKVSVDLTEAGRVQIVETRRLRTRWFTAQLALLDAEEREALRAAAAVLRKLADS